MLRNRKVAETIIKALVGHADAGDVTTGYGGDPGHPIDVAHVAQHWDELLRMAASIRSGTVTASAMLKRLSAYPRQNGLAIALREVGRLERSVFMLNWLRDLDLRRRTQAGLNKGEARNALARHLLLPARRATRPHFREPSLPRLRAEPGRGGRDPLEYPLPRPGRRRPRRRPRHHAPRRPARVGALVAHRRLRLRRPRSARPRRAPPAPDQAFAPRSLIEKAIHVASALSVRSAHFLVVTPNRSETGRGGGKIHATKLK